MERVPAPVEREEWDEPTSTWFAGIVTRVYATADEDLEAMVTRPADTVAGAVNLLTEMQERAA